MKIEWKGVFPALTTKFKDDGKLDLEAFDISVAAQLEAGVNGLILSGSLGEASVLSDDEKLCLVKHTVELVKGKVPVVVNISESTTRNAKICAAKAKDNGADGLMLLPPMRYRSDESETITFLKEVSKSTTLPVMIYNNPVDYQIFITLNMFEQLADLENVQAVKESTRDVSNITRMINRFGSRFRIFTGVDTLALESFLLGADGWVAGLVNAFPKESVAIYRLAKAGRYQEALAIYRWFLPILELDIHPKLVQYIKLSEQQTGIGTEIVRAPRLTLRGEERERVLKIINDGIASRPALPDYLSIEV